MTIQQKILLGLTITATLTTSYACAQNNMTATQQKPWTKPIWVVHRGGELDVPENTMTAIKHSVEMGAKHIEVDLSATGDGKIVLLHCDTLERTTTGSGKLSEHTWEQIKDLDAGSWLDPKFSDARIPLFSEVLAYCKEKDVQILLDIKVPEAAGANLYELIEQFDMVDNCQVYMSAAPGRLPVKPALDPRLTRFTNSLVQAQRWRRWWSEASNEEKREKTLPLLEHENVAGALVMSYQWVLDIQEQDEKTNMD